VNSGSICEVLRFGSDEFSTFNYSVEIGTAPRGRPRIEYTPARIQVLIDRRDAVEWQNTDKSGFDHLQSNGNVVIRLILAKDFGSADWPDDKVTDDVPNNCREICETVPVLKPDDQRSVFWGP
jgi:hypothetical protein